MIEQPVSSDDERTGDDELAVDTKMVDKIHRVDGRSTIIARGCHSSSIESQLWARTDEVYFGLVRCVFASPITCIPHPYLSRWCSMFL